MLLTFVLNFGLLTMHFECFFTSFQEQPLKESWDQGEEQTDSYWRSQKEIARNIQTQLATYGIMKQGTPHLPQFPIQLSSHRQPQRCDRCLERQTSPLSEVLGHTWRTWGRKGGQSPTSAWREQKPWKMPSLCRSSSILSAAWTAPWCADQRIQARGSSSLQVTGNLDQPKFGDPGKQQRLIELGKPPASHAKFFSRPVWGVRNHQSLF